MAFDSRREVLRLLYGDLGQHLHIIGRAFGVRVNQRGDEIRIQGDDGSALLARDLLEQLHQLCVHGFRLHTMDVEQACRLMLREPETDIVSLFRETVVVSNVRTVYPRTPTQRLYIDAVRNHDIVFGVGPAGTGKTYLAMAMALAALSRGDVNRIVLCRPAVEAGEKLGFLPGDLAEKVNPYLRPLNDALYDLVESDRADRLISKGIIEVAPLAFMRGRTLNSAFVILDEAQNTTPQQMKMFLTRLGAESHAVITGDITQIDLPRHQRSGLIHALGILRGIEGIDMVRFTDADVVRHTLVAAIIEAYDRQRPTAGTEAAIDDVTATENDG